MGRLLMATHLLLAHSLVLQDCISCFFAKEKKKNVRFIVKELGRPGKQRNTRGNIWQEFNAQGTSYTIHKQRTGEMQTARIQRSMWSDGSVLSEVTFIRLGVKAWDHRSPRGEMVNRGRCKPTAPDQVNGPERSTYTHSVAANTGSGNQPQPTKTIS